MRESSVTPTSFSFPKSSRILKSADFRNVYRQGRRHSARCFAAYLLAVERGGAGGPRLGFTIPRAFGKAVRRNRARRRIREALRPRFREIAPRWDVVINPRRPALDASPDELRRELDRLVNLCRA